MPSSSTPVHVALPGQDRRVADGVDRPSVTGAAGGGPARPSRPGGHATAPLSVDDQLTVRTAAAGGLVHDQVAADDRQALVGAVVVDVLDAVQVALDVAHHERLPAAQAEARRRSCPTRTCRLALRGQRAGCSERWVCAVESLVGADLADAGAACTAALEVRPATTSDATAPAPTSRVGSQHVGRLSRDFGVESGKMYLICRPRFGQMAKLAASRHDVTEWAPARGRAQSVGMPAAGEAGVVDHGSWCPATSPRSR